MTINEIAEKYITCRAVQGTVACKAKPGAKCVYLSGTSKGKPRTPHAERIYDAGVDQKGYNRATGELTPKITDLTNKLNTSNAQLSSVTTSLSATTASLKTATDNNISLTADINALKATNLTLSTANAQLTSDYNKLQSDFDAYVAAHPDVPVPPAPTPVPQDPRMPQSFADLATARAQLNAPADANYVLWNFGTKTLEEVFMTLGANDILVLPERDEPYWVDSADGFRAAGASAVDGQNGTKIPLVGTYKGKTARTWFAMARATRGVIGLGPGAVIQPTDSGFKQEAQIPDKSSTTPGRFWYNTAGVKQSELVGAQEKILEVASTSGYMGNFTMRGRNFGGVAYSGIAMKGGRAEKIFFDGAWRGFDKVPNGETGGLGVNKATYVIENCTFKAIDEQGKRIGSSPIMINSSPGGTMSNIYAYQAVKGMPTWWNCTGTHTINDFDSCWNEGHGVNLEQALDGFEFVWNGGKCWPNRSGNGGHPAPDGIAGTGLHIGLDARGTVKIILRDVDFDNNVTPGTICIQGYGQTKANIAKVSVSATQGSAPVAYKIF